MLVICTLRVSQLRVTTETLLNVAFAQQRIDCEKYLNAFIMTKVECNHHQLRLLLFYSA